MMLDLQMLKARSGLNTVKQYLNQKQFQKLKWKILQILILKENGRIAMV
jgi:hypothetical protein